MSGFSCFVANLRFTFRGLRVRSSGSRNSFDASSVTREKSVTIDQVPQTSEWNFCRWPESNFAKRIHTIGFAWLYEADLLEIMCIVRREMKYRFLAKLRTLKKFTKILFSHKQKFVSGVKCYICHVICSNLYFTYSLNFFSLSEIFVT